MHIGLIGGIGVAATRVYYTRLVAAIEALGGVPEVTIVHARAGDLVRNSRVDDRAAQVALYLPLLERLRDAGADCAAITSIGGTSASMRRERARRCRSCPRSARLTLGSPAKV